MRIHRNHRAVLVAHGLFRGNLQIDVHRQLQRMTRHCRLLVQLSHFLALAVYQHLPRAILTHQQLVVLQLDARFSDHVARVVELPLRLVQHAFADLAHISDQMGHEAVARIQTAMRHDGVQFGQFVAVSLDESQLVRRDVFLEIDGLILRRSRELVKPLANLFGIEMQPLGDEIGVSVRSRVESRSSSAVNEG